MSLPLNQVIQGDCIDVLKSFTENSIDCIVTDPPYGLSFMGKEWDKALPPKQAFVEMCRVLKPGALAFVMSSPRQDLVCRMGILLEDAGFKLSQSFISWVYASGFPKAYDISKGIDKHQKYISPEDFAKILKQERIKNGLKITYMDEQVCNNTTNYSWFEGRPAGTHIPKWDEYTKIKKILHLGDTWDDYVKEAERDKIGTYESDMGGLGGERLGKVGGDVTIPKTDEAKQWEGWKAVSGLKPALEVIFMVQKPLSEKTIVDNVLKWGTGAMNVDGCRIPIVDGGWNRTTTHKHDLRNGNYGNRENKKEYEVPPQESDPKGRFPANILVSDDVLNDGKPQKKGHNPKSDSPQTRTIYGKYNGINREEAYFNDIGSSSRYFDLDAWAQHHGILQVPKASTSERDVGLEDEVDKIPKSKFNLNNGSLDERFDGAKLNPRKNVHPTVKPIKLMAYLVELGCPPKGVVLDPFVGSGTTCIAAKQLSRNYIGIELSPEYAEMARKRIDGFFENLDMVFE